MQFELIKLAFGENCFAFLTVVFVTNLDTDLGSVIIWKVPVFIFSELLSLHVAYKFLRETQKKTQKKVVLLYNVYTYFIYIIDFYMIIRSKFGYFY